MALEVYPLINIIVILIFVFFLLVFAFMFLSFLRWFRAPAYYERAPVVKLEEYACPKCGSKDLELIRRRTIKCRKCGTIFTIRTHAAEEYWVSDPSFGSSQLMADGSQRLMHTYLSSASPQFFFPMAEAL